MSVDGVVAIIPARGGSKRLPRKNVYPILGVPMLAWSIRACRESSAITDVAVTTEDEDVASVARRWGAEVISRPASLATDNVYKQDAIVHALDVLEGDGRTFKWVLSVQANSPELTGALLDEAIDRFAELGAWELFSVDTRLLQNGAFRIMRRDVVRQRTLSVHCAVMIADTVDVHTEADALLVEKRLRAAAARVPSLGDEAKGTIRSDEP